MIIVTGAAGFIGSCLVNKLNNKGFDRIVIVDDFSREDKNKNISNKSYTEKVVRTELFDWLETHHDKIRYIYHLGARTDTTEFNMRVFDELNLNYSKRLWDMCVRYSIPLVYASSAATYGMGELGYEDEIKIIEKLKPLNPYGVSKNEFDKWVIGQDKTPPFWAGLKFFNVYGPNEYHKGRMASVVFHSYNQIKKSGEMKLFRSHNLDYGDGHQKRDFIYVKDVVNICFYFMINKTKKGIYNVGTGKARTFLDLSRSVFSAINMKENIKFIDTPEDIRDNYQYFTEAKMERLIKSGYDTPFYTLEEGIEDYVKSYLETGNYY